MDHFERIEQIREDFINRLWPINQSGNPEAILSIVANALNRFTDLRGKPLTMDLIVKKYQEYYAYMREINSGRDPKYFSKVFNIGEFVNQKMYNSDFRLPSNKDVDTYLYGATE